MILQQPKNLESLHLRTLIKTSGRTGSHVIAHQELERLEIDYLHHMNIDGTSEQLYAQPGPIVLHDHTRLIPPDSHDWDLIVSVRRNIYDQAVSFLIADATNNFGDRPATQGEFVLDENRLIECVEKFKELNYFWILIANFFAWKSVRIVYWEDQLPLDREYTLLNYPAADRRGVVNQGYLHSYVRHLLENHDWAIERAIASAERWIGIISPAVARQILVGDAWERGDLTAKQRKRLQKAQGRLRLGHAPTTS